MKTRKKIIIGIGVLLAFITAGGFFLHFQAKEIFAAYEARDDAYAVETTVTLLEHHLTKTNDTWPTHWGQLKEHYDANPNMQRQVWPEVLKRVAVDFSADPAVLSNSKINGDSPPFKVIWLKNGKSHYFSGAEPNMEIYRYLKRKRTEQADVDPDGPNP